MSILTRIIPGLASVLFVIGLEFAVSKPIAYIRLISLALLIMVLLIMVLFRRATSNDRLTLLTPPSVFLIGVSFALYFLYPSWVRQLVIGMSAIALLVYLEEVYRYLFEPERYHQHSIERLSSLLGIIAMETSLLGIFGLRIFLDTRLIYLLPTTFIVAVLVSTSILAVHVSARKILWPTVFIFSIVMTEMSLAVHFLPTNYLANSLLVTIPLYVALNLARHELVGSLNKMLLRRYYLTGSIAFVVILLSSQWVL